MRKTKIAKAMPFSGAPKINIAAVFGSSPNKPFLMRIPVIGERPISYGAENLPTGLELRGNMIVGCVSETGCHEITLTAENRLGRAEKKVTLDIAPNNILLTPLLGFTTWNAFSRNVRAVDVLNSAKNLVKHGIAEYGYSYVNLDSGWQYQYGGEYDAIQPNPKFPNMKEMTDEVHALGLKCGIYSTPMLTSWGCPDEYESIPGCTQGEADICFSDMMGGIGLIHKEKNNARQWAAWGFDYLKYDWAPTDSVNAELMRKELVATDRDFGFSVSTAANPSFARYWSNYTSSYRRNKDSLGFWQNLVDIYKTYEGHEKDMRRGHYFDLDMLDVGNSVFKDQENFLTEDEMIVAYSVRAFLNSPIQISAVLDEVSDFDLSLYCNEEIIAVNQDSAFSPAIPVFKNDEGESMLHIYEKLLEDGSYAYAVFNMGEVCDKVQVRFDAPCLVRDLWAKEDIGESSELSVTLDRHTVLIIKCTKKATEISML